MKNLKNLVTITLMAFFFIACQEDDQQFGEIIAPTNLTVDVEVTGADADNPFGDGSGEVIFNAKADNAISYSYVFNNTSESVPSGIATFLFSTLGVNTYTVTVVAKGKAGVTSSRTVEVEVLAVYDPPEELKTKLYGFDPNNPDEVTSKTWRIKAEVPGHFGLGPVGGFIPTEFFGAPANDKAGVGMYDDRYIFNSDGTFEFITDSTNDSGGTDPSGTVFGRVNLIDELGSSGGTQNGDDIENLPYSDFQENWQLIAPGGKENISLTGNGFIGYYVGGSGNYEIFDRSNPNEMLIRTTDGNGQFDWWFIITTEAP